MLLFQLGYMSEPTQAATEVQKSNGMYLWNAKKSEKTWRSASIQEDFNVQHDFFVHGTKTSNAISAIMDSGLKPSTFPTCKDPICGTPGVYFFSMPTIDQVSIKAAWKQVISSGHAGAAEAARAADGDDATFWAALPAIAGSTPWLGIIADSTSTVPAGLAPRTIKLD